jgi:predicted CoA-binding protein
MGNDETYPDALLHRLLSETKTIAMVGASDNPVRPSYFVMKYLLSRGFRVFPVNLASAGRTLLDVPVVASLADVQAPIDMVDIFRRSEAVAAIVEEALALRPQPRIIWMQLGVRNETAAARAKAAGLTVVMDRCPKIEYGRLSGEIGWSGVNSRVLSAKRPRMAATGLQRRLLAPKT